jgi:hypothetical protein
MRLGRAALPRLVSAEEYLYGSQPPPPRNHPWWSHQNELYYAFSTARDERLWEQRNAGYVRSIVQGPGIPTSAGAVLVDLRPRRQPVLRRRARVDLTLQAVGYAGIWMRTQRAAGSESRATTQVRGGGRDEPPDARCVEVLPVL